MKTTLLVIACVIGYVFAATCPNADSEFGVVADVYKAPQPTVTASKLTGTNTIRISLTMKRYATDQAIPVFHSIQTDESETNVCGNSDTSGVSAGLSWAPSSSPCSVTYTLDQPLAAIAAGSNDWVPTLDATGRTITYTLPVYTTYSITPSGPGSCYYVSSKTIVSFQTTLNVVGSSDTFVTADGTFKFRVAGMRTIKQAGTNFFEVAGAVTPLVPDSDLYGVQFFKVINANSAIEFQETSNDYDCLDEYLGNTPSSCTKTYKQAYPVLNAAQGVDIGGTYKVRVNAIVEPQAGNTRGPAEVTFSLSYTIPTDPNVVSSDQITTGQKLYSTNSFTGTERTNAYNTQTESLFVENYITSSVAYPSSYKLTFDSGVVCCVTFGLPLPECNVADGTNGLVWLQNKAVGTNGVPANAVSMVAAGTLGLSNDKYHLTVPLKTFLSDSTSPARPTMDCKVTIVSKFVDSAQLQRSIKGASNLNDKFVSTVAFSIQQPTVVSGAATTSVAVAFVVALIALML